MQKKEDRKLKMNLLDHYDNYAARKARNPGLTYFEQHLGAMSIDEMKQRAPRMTHAQTTKAVRGLTNMTLTLYQSYRISLGLEIQDGSEYGVEIAMGPLYTPSSSLAQTFHQYRHKLYLVQVQDSKLRWRMSLPPRTYLYLAPVENVYTIWDSQGDYHKHR